MPQQFDVTQALKDGYSEDDILAYLTQTRKFDIKAALADGHSKADIIKHLSSSNVTPPAKAVSTKQTPEELSNVGLPQHGYPNKLQDVLNNFSRIYEQGKTSVKRAIPGMAATGIATALAPETFGASIPLALGVGVDRAVRNYTGEVEDKSPIDSTLNIGKDTIEAALLEKLISGVTKVPFNVSAGGAAALTKSEKLLNKAGIDPTKLKDILLDIAEKNPGATGRAAIEYAKPGSYADPLMAALKAPFSAYKEFKNSIKSPFSSLEDIFAGGSKESERQAAMKAIDQQVEEHAKLLNPVFTGSAEKEAMAAAASAKEAYFKAEQESTGRGHLVQAIAANEPFTVTKTVPPQAGAPQLYSATGGLMPAQPTQVQSTIYGPSWLNNAAQKAKAIIDDAVQRGIKPTDYTKLENTAQHILNISDAGSGKITPIGFKEAWELKKDIGNYAANTFDNSINYVRGEYFSLANAIDDDISTSFNSWKANPQSASTASQLYNESKAIVKARQAAFFPNNEEGKSIGDVALNSLTKPDNQIDAITNDVYKLRRAKITGKLPIAGGVGQDPAIQYQVTNMNKDLKGYKFMTFFENAKSKDSLGNTIIDGPKLLSTFDDYANSEAGKELYTPVDKEMISRFFRAVSATTQRIQPSNKYIYLKAGTGVISLGAGLAEAFKTGSIPAGAEIGGAIAGAVVSAHVVARWLTNPKYARLLVAAAEGAPLSMSQKLASRILAEGAIGQKIELEYQDGKTRKGTVTRQGFKEDRQ